MRQTGIIIVLLALFTQTRAQTFQTCISTEEYKLYELIEDYRKEHGLPSIPLSKSLTYVAKLHAEDLQVNVPHKKDKCNLHSWSDSDKWSGCCYTSDHKQAKCMWEKPKELTTYTGYGFEISAMYSDSLDAPNALRIWQNSTPHDNVILNKDIWKEDTWQAIGIGINGSYAVVWFGKKTDEEGAPEKCN